MREVTSRVKHLQMIYFTFGTKDVLEHECKDLDQRLDLYMDNQRIDLPNLEALVVLNIASWGAGVRPWTLGTGKSCFPILLLLLHLDPTSLLVFFLLHLVPISLPVANSVTG